jgi:tail tubular protein A
MSFINTSHPIVLAAVNEIITSIGETPVEQLIDLETKEAVSTDAANALRLLDRHDRSVQAQGWTFNSHTGVSLTPDSHTGEIRLSEESILHIITSGYHIFRGHLYNGVQEEFTEPVLLDYIERVAFERLPVCFQEYITYRAMREFQVAYFGLGELVDLTREKEMEAWMHCQEYDLADAGINILDNENIQSFLNRRI